MLVGGVVQSLTSFSRQTKLLYSLHRARLLLGWVSCLLVVSDAVAEQDDKRADRARRRSHAPSLRESPGTERRTEGRAAGKPSRDVLLGAECATQSVRY